MSPTEKRVNPSHQKGESVSENTFGKRKKRYADIEAIFEELDE